MPKTKVGTKSVMLTSEQATFVAEELKQRLKMLVQITREPKPSPVVMAKAVKIDTMIKLLEGGE